jgi:uncharacterized membrane protein
MNKKGGQVAYELNRRNFLYAGLGAAAGSLPLISYNAALAQGANARWASFTPGFMLLLTEFVRYHKLDQKNEIGRAHV